MASVKKTFNINLDTKYAETNRKIMLTEGDTGVVFHIVLSDEGMPVDLSGCRVLAVFSNSNGTSSQDSAVPGNGVTIGGDDYNEITIDLKPSRFSAGYNECEIQVYSGDLMGTLITTARFNFSAVPSILNPDSIRDDERYPILLDLIQRVKDLQSGIGDMTKEAYDPDKDGKVLMSEYADRAETAFSADFVGGRSADYFASASALEQEVAARDKAISAAVESITTETIGAAKLGESGTVDGSQSYSPVVNEIDTTYTLSLADAGKTILTRNTAAATADHTIIIPSHSEVPFPTGTEIAICRYYGGAAEIKAADDVYLYYPGSPTSSGGHPTGASVHIARRHSMAAIKKLFRDYWIVTGDIEEV